MRFPGLHPELAALQRAVRALSLTRLLAVVLAALLFMPPWMLPRAAAMLPLVPVQNPSEEESHSSHSAAAQLQQLSAVFSGKVRRPAAERSRSAVHPRPGSAALGLARRDAQLQSDQTRRNGCGGPLRC
jgi:hypothetical protein